jgi:hypothetical protein
MTNLHDLTASQLHRIIAIREQIEALQGELATIAGDEAESSAPTKAKKGKRRMSAAGRAAISAAAKARWARVKGTTATPKVSKKKDRRSSPAVRAKLAAAARARWAKVRAAGKTRL